MKYFRLFYLANLLLLVLLLQSCGASNDVVSNRLIQKRKFNKGWHINSSKRQKQKGATADVELKDESQKKVKIKEKRSWATSENKQPEETIETQSEIVEQTVPDTEIETHLVEDSEVFVSDELDEKEQPIVKEDSRVINPEPSSLDKAKSSYNKSWMYTIAAIVAITAGLLLFMGAWGWVDMILGGALIGVAVVAYIFMFINLTKAAKHVGALGSPENGGLRFLIWAHIVIGSLVSILLFLIPLLTVSINVKKSR